MYLEKTGHLPLFQILKPFVRSCTPTSPCVYLHVEISVLTLWQADSLEADEQEKKEDKVKLVHKGCIAS